jgi:hypothetical protein
VLLPEALFLRGVNPKSASLEARICQKHAIIQRYT